MRIADRYLITGDLGAGGMGVVVKARDERLGRSVAMKLLSPQTLGDEAARARLMREARAVAALDHPNIVHVYDVGETEDGGAFLVMEMVKGKSLRDHLHDGTLSRPKRLQAVIDVARALAFAHASGFVHRDIKPDNIMTRDDGRTVVLDFGLAKTVALDLATTVDAINVTANGNFIGTPAYAAPEQMLGEATEPKTDQFALAVTAYELMTGHLPWKGHNPLEVISEVLKGEEVLPSSMPEMIPEAVRDAICRALSKKTAERFDTIDAFADVLVSALPQFDEPRMSGNPAQTVSSGKAVNAPVAQASIATTMSSPSATPSATPDPIPSAAPARTISASIVTPAAQGSGALDSTSLAAKKPKSWLLPAAAAVLVLGVGTWWVRGHRTNAPEATPSQVAVAPSSPLAAPTSILACPVLEASDSSGAKAGWMGAAAASLLCERAQLMLGGDPLRTLVPAELLSLPREPSEDFPRYSFEAPETRTKTIAAAKSGAAAYVDGMVTHGDDFRVTLSLRRSSDGVEVAKGDAHGAVLVDTVGQAMETLRPLLPAPSATPFLSTWWLGASVDAALELHDLHVAVVNEDDVAMRIHCDRARARTDLGGMQPFVAALCADKLYQKGPAPVSVDAATPAALLTSVAALRFAPTADEIARNVQRDRVKLLTDAATKEPATLGKALLLGVAAESSYLAMGDLGTSAEEARASIQASAKLVDVRANAWHRQGFGTNGNSVPVLYAHAAWLPWESFALSNLSRLTEEDKPGRPSIEGVRRAAVMGHSGYWPRTYGEYLVQAGKLEAATSVAVEIDSDYLRALIAHSEHRPKAALELVTSALAKLPARPENGGLASRYAATAVEIAELLHVETSAPRDFYTRFVAVEPVALTRGIVTFFGSVATCGALDPATGTACLDRMQKLFDAGYFGAAFRGAKELMAAERLSLAGKHAEAAEACRPLTAEVFLAGLVEGAVTRLLVGGGLDDLAAKLDNGAVAQGNMLPTADLAYARAANRALKAGDLRTAKKLATLFVERWDAADQVPPVLAEMQKIVDTK